MFFLHDLILIRRKLRIVGFFLDDSSLQSKISQLYEYSHSPAEVLSLVMTRDVTNSAGVREPSAFLFLWCRSPVKLIYKL